MLSRLLIGGIGYGLYVTSIFTQLVPTLPPTNPWTILQRLGVIIGIGILGSATNLLMIAKDPKQGGPAAGIAVIGGTAISFALPSGMMIFCGMQGTVGTCLCVLPIVYYGLWLWGRANASD
eukprot:PhF_6_TR20563/c0_g1_i1/m.29690